MNKKILSGFLAMLFCLFLLPSCERTQEDEATVPPEEPVPMLSIVADGVSDYRIVIASDAAEFEEDAAYDLRLAIKMFAGVELPIVRDSEEPLDTEIVIGVNTARSTLYQAPAHGQFGYAAFVANQRIVIEAGTDGVLQTAISQFFLDCTGMDINSDALYTEDARGEFSIAQNYQRITPFVDVSDTLLTKTDIVYDGTYIQKRMAYCLFDEIKLVKYKSDLTVTTESSSDAFVIVLCKSEDMGQGRWKIEIPDTNLMKIYANDYYGFTATAKYLKKALKARDGTTLTVGACLEGDHIALLEQSEMASAYVYNQTAEYRVMFNNVLWNDPVPAERNVVTAEIVAQYKPDVLGLQEVNWSKRGDAGENDLTVLLANLGYAESIDPRVKNVGSFGSSGSRWVTVNYQMFRTFYNCTPLFYNQNTTICIDSGYYWYENQIDNENKGDCGAGDCASKAMTWGVFESKATGDRYIVVSTHMCTRSSGIRGLQAQEAVKVIKELTETYDYPVILGGDMNGTATAENYRYFTSAEGGFENVLEEKLPSLFCSNITTHHMYPVVNATSGMVDAPSSDNAGWGGNVYLNIDHIFIGNASREEMDVTVLGIVLDDCSTAGSDHLPIYIDFSIP